MIVFATVGVYDQPTGILMRDLREMYNLERLSEETMSGGDTSAKQLRRIGTYDAPGTTT
jgi:hypothetical protein